MVKGGGKPSSPPNNLWQSKSSESDWSRGRHDGFSEGRHKGSYKGGNADADFERWQKGDIISNSWRGEKGDVIFKGTAAEKGKGSDIGAMSKGKWDGFQEAAGLQSGQTAGALWQSQSHGKQMPKGKRHDGASILDEALGKGWEGHPLQDEYSLPNFSKGESAPSGSPSYRRGAYDKGGLGKDFVAGNGKDNWKGNAEVFNSGKGKGIESLSKGAASDIFSNGGGPMMSDPRRRIHNEEMAPNRVGGQSPHLEARGGKGMKEPLVDSRWNGNGNDASFQSGWSGKGKDGFFDSGCSGKGKDTFFDSAWSGKGKDLFFDSGCSGKGKDTPFVSDWNGKGKFNHSFESPENGGQMFHQMDFGKGKGSKNQLGPPLVDEQSGNKVSFEELMAVGKSLDDKGLQPTPLSAPSIPRTPSYQTSAGTAPAALSTSPMSPMGNQFWTPQGLPTSPMASMQQTGSPMASTYFSAPASFPDTWAAPQSAHQGRGAFDNIEPDGIRTPSDEGYGAEIAASIAAEMSKLLEPSPAEAAPWTPQDLTMPGLAKGLAKGAKGESGKDKGKAKDKKLSHLAEITRAQQQASIRAGRESFGTQEVEEGHPITGPMDFMGIWIDLNGNSVTVHSLDAYQVQLTATLSRAPRPDALLKIEPLDEGGWLCGNAKLDQSISSTQRLRWVRGNGQVSEWVRCRR
eukprot:TRINITY_DN3097_c0_g1_i3.p1 TRINITY_DN3097_c0_g1~~TRINITY_DN3097_c0_g1_i3.p1  ORF type:complete len:684 (-),score=151.52 TRINITY_DN3097_c0_g1_i3:59-2110(-)